MIVRQFTSFGNKNAKIIRYWSINDNQNNIIELSKWMIAISISLSYINITLVFGGSSSMQSN